MSCTQAVGWVFSLSLFISPSPLVYIRCRLLHPSGFPLGFPSCLSTAPWSTEPSLCHPGWDGERTLLPRGGEKTRGTTSGKPSSPPKQKFNRRAVSPKVHGKPGSSIAIKGRLPMGRACLPPCERSWGNCLFLLFPCTRGRRKGTKNCLGFFFLSSHFFYLNAFKVNFKKLGTLDSFN